MTPLVEAALAEGVAQLSLALFTTVTSGGIVACMIVAAYVLGERGDEEARARLCRHLIIPLAAVIVGLIASTNHLGRPSNTLYVLMGIGRSPLSNEVAAVVVFTGLAWIAWLLSFARNGFRLPVKVLLFLSVAAGVVALTQMASAYSITTVITWDLPYTRMNLVLAGLVSGPVLALCTFSAAQACSVRLSWATIGTSFVFALALTISEVAQCATLQSLQSGLHIASDLVPFYPTTIVVSSVMVVVALALLAVSLLKRRIPTTGRCAVSVALLFFALLAVRFVFYCMRLTAGI